MNACRAWRVSTTMSNPFDTDEMARGYACFRPPVHLHVIGRIRKRLGGCVFPLAVDIGCGAGRSTAALQPLAVQTVGLDPAVGMVRGAARTVPSAWFLAAAAEHLPLRSGSAGLLCAAGSLNWADLDRFFPEARRVLAADGLLIVYDFSQGRVLLDGSAALADWEDEFKRRYPSPPCRQITPDTLDLDRHGFRLLHSEEYEVPLRLSREFYLGYAMTETNVAAAISRGESEAAIRDWCRATLENVFTGDLDVVFQGFLALIVPEGS